MTTPLSTDRIDALLREAEGQQRRPGMKRNRSSSADRYFGTFMEPRPSTDPAIDQAARSVADAILQEPGNQQQFLNVRQCYSMPVPDVRGSGAVVYEWNVNRIINDRVWDWMLWMSRNGPAVRDLNPPLPEGYFRAHLYHQCGPSCNDTRQNLLRTSVASASLTACVLSGVVHLCRANSKSCTVLEEGDDTQLTCQESGMVCRDVGVHMSGAGDMRFMKAQRGIELGMGVRSDGGNRSSADPESVRRASAIEAMRDTCPQIVGWNRDTGELTVNMSIVPDQSRGEVFFDPSFYWVVVAAEDRGETMMPLLTQPLGTAEPKSYVGALGTMSQAMQTEKKRWQRSTRLKRVRTVARHRHRRRADPHGPQARSELLSEQDAIERVLDHVLWDAETRERVNAAQKHQVSESVAHNLQHHIQPRNVSDLLTSMARLRTTQNATPDPKVLTTDTIHAVCMSTLRGGMVPVICFDETIHTQLVVLVLYLWNFIVHVPENDANHSNGGGGGGGSESRQSRPKKRRYRETPAASLTQFTLAVLYTAASSGIYIGTRVAWPKDWWLADHLPAERTLRMYYGAKHKLCDHHRLRGYLKTTAKDPLDYMSPPIFASANGVATRRKPRRDYQTTALYDTKDVACGTRELVTALCTYDGARPDPAEASARLYQAYLAAYWGTTTTTTTTTNKNNNNNTTEIVDKSEDWAIDSTTTTTTMQAQATTPVRFCCMFVPRGATTEPRRRLVHICVMFDPYDAAGPPMLRKYSNNVVGDWTVDTVIGPFLHDADARAFCVEWGRDRCGVDARRRFGIRLAQRLGLRIWVEDAQVPPLPPAEAMRDDPFDAAIPQRRAPAPKPKPKSGGMFDLWTAFSEAASGEKNITECVMYDGDGGDEDDVEMAPAPRAEGSGVSDVAYHLFRHWQM